VQENIEVKTIIIKNMLPRTLWVDMTNKCNNKCTWCYAKEAINSENLIEIKISFLKEKISTFIDIGIKKIVLIGGEPTLHQNFFEILDLLHSNNFQISLVTNGRAFEKEEFCKELLKYGVDVTFSFHGFSEENYIENTKQRNAFKQVINGFKNLSMLKLTPDANFVLSKYTFEHSKDIVKFVKNDLKLSHVGFNVATPSIGEDTINSEYVLPFEDSANHVFDMFNIMKKENIRATFLVSIPLCFFKKEHLKILLDSNALISGCHVKYGAGLVLKSTGSITVCNHLLSYELADAIETKRVLNNRKEFEEFWLSNSLTEFRKKVNFYPYTKCKSCEHWSACGGGCFINHIKETEL
jgi:radical SAM protein with 4Fe4S-binding SPASM domain